MNNEERECSIAAYESPLAGDQHYGMESVLVSLLGISLCVK